MRRLLKILGVLIVLIIVALVGLVMFLPTGQIVQLVADQVKAQTGRDLQIAGDVSPSFTQFLGLRLKASPSAMPNGLMAPTWCRRLLQKSA